jgi:hypothetical protein
MFISSTSADKADVVFQSAYDRDIVFKIFAVAALQMHSPRISIYGTTAVKSIV